MPQSLPPEPKVITYSETSEFEWTKRAFELLGENELTATTYWSAGIASVVIAGPCPRCGHDLVDRQVGVVVAGLSNGAPRSGIDARHGSNPPPTLVVDVTCGCGLVHEGAAETVTGCGVSFRIELEAVDSKEGS